MSRRIVAGLSLIEIIAAIGILLALIAALSPAISRSRWQAHEADAVSGLRQLALASHLYLDSNGDWPSREQLKVQLGDAACDDRDNRPARCSGPAPYVGSMAYRPSLAEFTIGECSVSLDAESGAAFVLAGAPFSADAPFDADVPYRLCQGEGISEVTRQRVERSAMPERRLLVWSDSSVKVVKARTKVVDGDSIRAQIFTWPAYFEPTPNDSD
jgi:type II secretory pathway pseudopilin PulG